MEVHKQNSIRQEEMPQFSDRGRTAASQSDCERNKRVL